MVEIALNVALILLALGLPVTLYRLVEGPTPADRLLAVETTMLLALGLIAVFTVKYAPELFPAVVRFGPDWGGLLRCRCQISDQRKALLA